MTVEFVALEGRRTRASFTPYRAVIKQGRRSNTFVVPTPELMSAAQVAWDRLRETSGQNWTGHVFCGSGSYNTYVGFQLSASSRDRAQYRVLVIDRATSQIIKDEQKAGQSA